MKGGSIVKEIQIKNFRCLKDTGLQKLSPITILVGENSSGKSTFLRAFPLLKQSISKRTSGPILWAGDVDDYVDFGSFEETVTNDTSDSITFRFDFDAESFARSHYYWPGRTREAPNLPPDSISYEIVITSQNNREFVSQCNLTVNDISTKFNLITNTVSLNDSFSYTFKGRRSSECDPREMRNIRSGFCPRSMSFGFFLPNYEEIWQEIIRVSPHEGDEKDLSYGMLYEVFRDISRQLVLSNHFPNTHFHPLKSHQDYPSWYVQLYNHIVSELNSSSTNRLRNLLTLFYIYTIFPDIDMHISVYFRNVHYIAPLRATAERYYRLRNLAVDEVDFQGKNLAIFINSLTDSRRQSFQNWTNEHFGFSVATDSSAGHISLRVKLKGSTKAINLSDTGFGYSQVLPIITQLWELSSRHARKSKYNEIDDDIPLLIAIEQPELHLHPALQAKLAKAFIACIDLARKNGHEIQLVLETHSETIINYLGRAIANNQLSPDDVSLILFERDFKQGVTHVKNSSYDESGFLMNWPYGFLDSEE